MYIHDTYVRYITYIVHISDGSRNRLTFEIFGGKSVSEFDFVLENHNKKATYNVVREAERERERERNEAWNLTGMCFSGVVGSRFVAEEARWVRVLQMSTEFLSPIRLPSAENSSVF